MKPYELWLLAGAVGALATTLVIARWRDISRATLCVTAVAASIGAAVGARLLHVLLHPKSELFAVEWEGFALDGALAGILFAVLITAGKRSGAVLDHLAPGLGVGIALAKIGCWVNGCCFGAITDVPWAVTAPAASVREVDLPFLGVTSPTVLVHPTQFYELTMALSGAILAVVLLRSTKRVGLAFSLFLVWIEGFRAIEFQLRTPDESALIWPGTISTGIALVAAAVAVLILRRLPHEVRCKEVLDP